MPWAVALNVRSDLEAKAVFVLCMMDTAQTDLRFPRQTQCEFRNAGMMFLQS
jgi:hypothetical protein